MSKTPHQPELRSDAAPMDQVRDLLFGAQLKDMETRFQRQEERFQREIADAKDAFKARLDSLENFMRSESASLLHRLQETNNELDEAVKAEQRDRIAGLKAESRERSEALRQEQRERVDALDQIAKELSVATESMERKLNKLAGTLDATEQELRRLLLAESGNLSDKIEEKYQDALNVLANTAAQIRHDMVHRSALSGMFTETAVKLSGQWTPEVGRMLAAQDPSALPDNGNGADD